MADFLLELRCEEIPARMQKGARADLEKLFRGELEAAGVKPDRIAVWSTPRRLALIAYGLPDATEAVSEEAKGPPEGAPDQAIDGFCRKNGVMRDQLELRDVKGRMTWFAVRDIPGRAVKDVLAEAIPAIVRAFPWPKSMRWGDASLSNESLRWVRPLSGIVAIFGEELVECEVGGIASAYVTRGHRFHHPDPITIGRAEDYAEKLRACHVIVDHEERQNIIRLGATKAAADAGLKLVEDEGLVIENAGLTEWPVPLLGRFDEHFLEVPPEVIQLTARVNQKYFVCEDQQGKLANAFVCTANIAARDDGAAIVDGNRKVLAARLSDARFFWEVDQKTTLAEQAKKLERITFHEKLGTLADKVERVAKLARWLMEEGIVKPSSARPEAGEGRVGETPRTSTSSARTVSELADLAEQAARLCKADLVTEMVGEFPELQGLMGGYYAEKEGLPQEVSEAIRDHYKPVGQGDDVPTAPVTVAVSLADKIDTLAGFYFEQMPPTGSKDPFALRRAALGVVGLIQQNRMTLSLDSVLKYALWWVAFGDVDVQSMNARIRALNAAKPNTESAWGIRALLAEVEDMRATANSDVEKAARFKQAIIDLLDFFADRLKVQQKEAGVRHDLIDAVFALGGEDDLVRLLARVHALQAFVETEDGTNLLAGYKRAANILKKEEWNTQPVTPAQAGGQDETYSSVNLDSRLRGNDEDSLEHTGDEDPLENVDDPDMRAVYAAAHYTLEPAEKALTEALDVAEPKAAAAIEAEDFEAAMSALASLRAPIDAFFDEVTVNDENKDKRAARLDLLDRFRVAVHKVADFSRIEG